MCSGITHDGFSKLEDNFEGGNILLFLMPFSIKRCPLRHVFSSCFRSSANGTTCIISAFPLWKGGRGHLFIHTTTFLVDVSRGLALLCPTHPCRGHCTEMCSPWPSISLV